MRASRRSQQHTVRENDARRSGDLGESRAHDRWRRCIERFSKVFAAARGRIEIKLPANFGEKLTLSIL
jgi:hypothetical protein